MDTSNKEQEVVSVIRVVQDCLGMRLPRKDAERFWAISKFADRGTPEEFMTNVCIKALPIILAKQVTDN